MNQELMVEHLGFAPVQFVDQVLNMVNETMYKSMTRFERIVETQAGIQETERVLLIDKGMQAIETLFEKSIDNKFDRFEIYVLKNIFDFHQENQVVLPHYKGLDINITTHEEAELDKELDLLRVKLVAQRYVKNQLLEHKKGLQDRKQELKKLNSLCEKVQENAEDIFPLDKNVSESLESLVQLESKMEQIEHRTADIEWTQVPLIGSSAPNSSRLPHVQAEILDYLKQVNQEKVSAWDVTHEYRDAVDVGSVKGIERIKHVFGLI